MIKGVIFDMDGTITKPYIDWKALRGEIGVSDGSMIMDHIACLEGAERRRATEILERQEEEASVNSELNVGVKELLDYLKDRGIRTCLVTNNNRRSIEIVLTKHNLIFDFALSREDGRIKPSADLIVKALKRLDLRKEEVVFIGDGRLDMEASAQAGIRGIYLTNASPAFEHPLQVDALFETIDLIETWSRTE